MISKRIMGILVAAFAIAACSAEDDQARKRGADGMDGGTEVVATPEPAETAADQPSGWQRLDWAPSDRTEVAAAVVGTEVFVIGGLATDGSTLATVEIFDTVTGDWSEGPDLPVGLNHAMAAGVDDTVYVFGGYRTFAGEISSAAYRLADDGWHELSPLPEARAAAAAPVVDGIVYLAGGMGGPDGASYELVERDMLVYDVAADEWSTAPGPPTPREHVAGAGVDGRAYVLGGRAGHQDVPAAEAYDPETGEWIEIDPLPTARGGLAVTAVCDRYVIAAGGERIEEGRQAVFDEVEALDTITGTWQSLPPMPTARHGLGIGMAGTTLATLVGGPSPGLFASAAVETLDLSWLDGC